MNTEAISAPTADFEDAPAAPASQRLAGKLPSGTISRDCIDQQEIARQTLRKTTLGDLLRIALDDQDADRPNTLETTMVLDIPVIAVESRVK